MQMRSGKSHGSEGQADATQGRPGRTRCLLSRTAVSYSNLIKLGLGFRV